MKKWLKSVVALASASLAVSGVVSVSPVNVSAEEVIEIEYWHGNADTQGGQSLEQLVNEYNESQDKVKVTPVYHDGLYVGIMQSLQTSAAAGEVPGLVQIGWAYREYFKTNFHFTDPETLITEVGQEGDENYLSDKFPEEMLNLARDYEGNLLGLPYSVSTAIIYVNPDLLEEAGVDYTQIDSYEDLYAASAQIYEATGKYGYYKAESNDNWTSQQIVESNGSQILAEDGSAAFADEKGIKSFQDWADGIAAGHILHGTTEEGHQAFISGDVGMVHTTIAQRANITNNAGFEAIGFELPAYEGQEHAVPAGGALLAVTALEEEEKAAAWDFIKFLYLPDSIATWTEGTGYLPATTDATENEALKQLIETDQLFQTSYNQLPVLVRFASFPGNRGLEASEVLRDGRDRILNGEAAADVLPSVQEEINELIK